MLVKLTLLKGVMYMPRVYLTEEDRINNRMNALVMAALCEIGIHKPSEQRKYLSRLFGVTIQQVGKILSNWAAQPIVRIIKLKKSVGISDEALSRIWR